MSDVLTREQLELLYQEYGLYSDMRPKVVQTALALHDELDAAFKCPACDGEKGAMVSTPGCSEWCDCTVCDGAGKLPQDAARTLWARVISAEGNMYNAMGLGDEARMLLSQARKELDAAKRERDALHQYPLAAKYDRDAGWKYSPHFLQRIVQMSETIEPDGESLSLEQVEQVLSALDALRAKESQ